MKTRIISEKLEEAAALLREGGLVAVPTETVYGLAGNGLDAAAVERIYEVKGRPAVKPLSLMVPGPEAMEKYAAQVPPAAKFLAERFWPGPLTIVLKARDHIPPIVLAGGHTVGLRCPQHPMTLELLNLSGLPFAAPSANPSGAESPKTAEQVRAYFDGKIEAIVDGGPCDLGLESTIIDMSGEPYRILRQGALPASEIRSALAESLQVIGITGGTGSGKTTALQVLADMGALILDCDAIYHQLLQTDTDMLSQIESAFPGVVSGGVLDRKALGAVVFSDEQALLRLNAITHRCVDREVQRRLEDFALTGGRIAAIDAIELFAGNQARRCQKTLAVLAKPEIRAERIMRRDGISREYAMLRIQAQRPDSYFEERCDYILRNDAGPAEFAAECRKLFKEILTNG